MASLEEIVDFVRAQAGYDGELRPESSLQDECGVYGDDMTEFLAAYGKRFEVDLSRYLWYLHTGDEGFLNIGGLFYPPPNARVKEIPITMGMLHEFAQRGEWTIDYPPHQLPEGRPDLRINQAVAAVALALLAIVGIRACMP